MAKKTVQRPRTAIKKKDKTSFRTEKTVRIIHASFQPKIEVGRNSTHDEWATRIAPRANERCVGRGPTTIVMETVTDRYGEPLKNGEQKRGKTNA